MLASVPRLDADAEAADARDDEALDAYSLAVSTVAERLIPSVASLRVSRGAGGRWSGGAGSAVAIEPIGYLVTSAHVVAGAEGGTATFVDGAELEFLVVGRDPLSDLAVVKTAAGEPHPGQVRRRRQTACRSTRRRHRQSTWLRRNRDGRRRQRPRSLASDARRPRRTD